MMITTADMGTTTTTVEGTDTTTIFKNRTRNERKKCFGNLT
jgi:hypothetical protein